MPRDPPPYGGPPPPYPGLGTYKHSPIDLQPPPYSKSVGSHPIASSGGTHHHNHHHHRSHYYPTHYGGGYGSYRRGYTNETMANKPNPTQWGGYGNPVYGPFGNNYGGFSPYGAGFGFNKNSGSGSFGSHLGAFVAGAMISNLANNVGRSNFHVYHNAPKYQKEENRTKFNITENFDDPNEAKIALEFGNMTCLTIYNARKFAEWANKTIKDVEEQTNQTFPFNLNINETSVQFNFTLEPGEIKHNETISITCCGAEQIVLDYEDAFRGRDPNTNCVHMVAKIPFREIKVVPLNTTLNVTKDDIDSLLPSTSTTTPSTTTEDLFITTTTTEGSTTSTTTRFKLTDLIPEDPVTFTEFIVSTTTESVKKEDSDEEIDMSLVEWNSKFLESLRKKYQTMYPGIQLR